MAEPNRREVLQAICALGSAALLPGCSEARELGPQPFFQKIGKPIGLQLYTLGEAVSEDPAAIFDMVAAMGYGEIEMSSLHGRAASEIRSFADAAGLAIASLQIPPESFFPGNQLTFEDDPARIAEICSALGVANLSITVPLMPEGFSVGEDEDFPSAVSRALTSAGADIWKSMAERFNRIAETMNGHGIALAYHNHNLEFAPIGGGSGWEILVEELDPALVGFQVDVGWVAAAGLDPAAFLNGLSGRVSALHVKDVAAGNRPNYALAMSPAEVGSGTIDWASVLVAAHAAGAQHYFVEQEPPFSIPRAEAAAKSYDYLSQLVI